MGGVAAEVGAESAAARREALRARAAVAFARLRWLLYAPVVPLFTVIALDLKRPEGPALAAVIAGALVAAALVRWGALPDERVRRLRERRLVRAADLLLWTGLVTVLSVEGTLSLAAAFVQHPLLTPPNARSRERIANVRFKPHAPVLGGHANARGFHDSEWAVPKPPGRIRIAALGDSFAVGIVPYAQNELTLLEERLRARTGLDVEVCNLGVSSTSPVDYETILRDEGLALEPDVVLVCTFTGNDFEPLHPGSRLRGPNWRSWALCERLYHIYRQRRLRAAEEAAARERAAAAAAPGAPAAAPATPTASAGEPRPEKLSHEGYLDLVAGLHVKPLETPLPAEMETRMRETLEVLTRIVDMRRPRPAAVAVFPAEVQVRRALLDEVARTRGVRPEGLDLDQAARRIHEALAGHATVVDLRPALLAAEADHGPVYEADDSHWNAAGNAAVADALADALTPIVLGLRPPK